MDIVSKASKRAAFIARSFPNQQIEEQELPADASFRTYYRLSGAGRPLLLMQDPPGRGAGLPPVKVEPFRDIANHLRSIGLRTPEIIAEDIENGLLILEDFGHQTYTQLLNKGDDPKPLFEGAIDVLSTLHNHPERHMQGLAPYDTKALLAEATLLTDWYIPAVYNKTLSDADKRSYENVWSEILNTLPKDQKTLVLRDYHVDNLMKVGTGEGLQSVGLLDFQDALIGHFSYDVMSLLEDARRAMDEDLYDHLLQRYLNAMPGVDQSAFLQSFKVLAAQRHAKVLGIFVRLARRDEKPRYLNFLPHVHQLFLKALKDDRLQPLKQWFNDQNIDIKQIPKISIA